MLRFMFRKRQVGTILRRTVPIGSQHELFEENQIKSIYKQVLSINTNKNKVPFSSHVIVSIFASGTLNWWYSLLLCYILHFWLQ